VWSFPGRKQVGDIFLSGPAAALVQDHLPENLALLRLDPRPIRGPTSALEVFALVERAYVRREGLSTFISYRREGGSETARLISTELQSRGVKTFLDLDNLGPHHFDERLYNEIEDATNFVLVLSPNCLDRCVEEEDWLRREIGHAIRTKRNIVPILKDGFSFQELPALPLDLTDLPRYNCVRYSYEYFDATMDRLVGFLVRTQSSADAL
jgi:hypothetical protein